MNIRPLVSLATLFAFGIAGVAAAHDDDQRSTRLSPEERVELEAKLDETRERMRELAAELGELSVRLADGPIHKMVERIRLDHDRAVLGVSIESRSDDPGVRVHAVTPGGPAEAAGLETGDVIVAIGGTDLTGGDADQGLQALMEVMRAVEPGDAVSVTVERDGRRITREVVTEKLGEHASAFAFSTHPDMDFDFSFDTDASDFIDVEEFEELGEKLAGNFTFLWHGGPWSDLEVVELTPQLGAYFGVDEGLLVVRAPEDDSLGLQDGDVIVELNGERVTTPRAFTRSLRAGEAGDRVALEVVRQRATMRLEAQVPELDRDASVLREDDDGRRVIIKRRYADGN